jgi:hypothetical protein
MHDAWPRLLLYVYLIQPRILASEVLPRMIARTLATLSALVLSYALAAAQTPPATPPAPGQGQGQQRGPRPAPTNIKALPKNITGDQVIKLMRQYEGDLGVQCEFCHAQNPATKRNDFASDANPTKDVARYMITMTAELNDKWLAEMPDRRYADPITCGTCHRGEKHPSVFTPPPPAPRAGAPAAAPPK